MSSRTTSRMAMPSGDVSMVTQVGGAGSGVMFAIVVDYAALDKRPPRGRTEHRFHDVEGVAEVQVAGARLADSEPCSGRWARTVGVGGCPPSGARVGHSFECARAHELEQPLLGGSFAW
jgi:hypothetical protein